jgi:Galactose oxidase, central domain
MIHYIFLTSVRLIFCCQDPLQLIRTSSIPVSREWTRIVVNGPGPGRRYYHTMTLVGSKVFVFGGMSPKADFNDIWAFDLNCCTFAPRFPEPF